MSKVGSHDIYQLIRSLSQTEKRYFKIFSQKHVLGKENKYVKLFDVIDNLQAYDEKKLHGFGNLPSLKKHLYKSILRCLESYHVNYSPEYIVKSSLQQVEILFGKGLLTQSEKILKKAKIIARKYDLFPSLLEIIQWEHQIIWQDLKNLDKAAELIDEETNFLSLLVNKKEHSDLADKMLLAINQKGLARSKMTAVENLLKNPLLKDKNNALAFDAERMFYHTWYFYYRMKGDMQHTYEYARKKLMVYEKNPERIQQNIPNYLTCLSTLIIPSLELKKQDEALEYLDRLNDFRKTLYIPLYKKIGFSYFCTQKMNYIMSLGLFEQNKLEMEKLASELKEYEHALSLPVLLVVHSNMAIVYFGQKKYTKSIECLNRIRNDKTLPIRPDLDCFIRIFYIIVHFEAGDTDLLKSLVKSANRYLIKKKRLYKVEKIILDFMSEQLVKTNSKVDFAKSCKKLKSDLLEIMNDPFQKNIFQEFDFISWAESKIQNCTFEEIVRKQNTPK